MTYHIIGKIQSITTKPNPFNFNRTNSTKMVVLDKAGMRYQGTRPISLRDAKVGDTIVFKAEISRHHRLDKWFYFYNPRMAAIK